MTLPAASDWVSITKKANSLRGKPRGTDPRKDWNKMWPHEQIWWVPHDRIW